MHTAWRARCKVKEVFLAIDNSLNNEVVLLVASKIVHSSVWRSSYSDMGSINCTNKVREIRNILKCLYTMLCFCMGNFVQSFLRLKGASTTSRTASSTVNLPTLKTGSILPYKLPWARRYKPSMRIFSGATQPCNLVFLWVTTRSFQKYGLCRRASASVIYSIQSLRGPLDFEDIDASTTGTP